jgi:hypothetical protein
MRLTLPSLARFRGLTLVDTPGLDSIFSQNTEAALTWSPKVDLVIVAVAVDPPLTQLDVALIERLHRFTPNVSILLTKVDTLEVGSQQEVLTFVEKQLETKFPRGLRVFPFSFRPGFDCLRERFDREYVANALTSFHERHAAALARKLQTLPCGIADYLQLAVNAAEVPESDREHLRKQVLVSEDSLNDQRLPFQLLAKHAAGRTRPLIEDRLQKTALSRPQQKLGTRLASEFPGWRGSFAQTLSQFESWLHAELESEISSISAAEAGVFQESLRDFRRQCQETLQAFRERLSERVLGAFGSPLRTTQAEIELQPPRAPDVSVGKIFDHNGELLSALLPMALVRGEIRRRFEEKIESEVFKNLSRLTSQWDETVPDAIQATEKETERRCGEPVRTVQRLLFAGDPESKAILLSYLEKVATASNRLASPSEDCE